MKLGHLAQAVKNTPPKLRRNGLILIAVTAALLIGGATLKAISVSHERQSREADLAAGPLVKVDVVTREKAERQVSVVGESRPYASVTLYAKVSGYLKKVGVDKGDAVKKGQILAIIESPEIDKDYLGAEADSKNKQAIAGRMKKLLDRSLVSPQEAEQAISDAAVAKAKFEAIAVEKGYEILKAPFDGVITARYADPGALMQNATNSQTSALPVVNIAQVDTLRIYAYLDQGDALYAQAGTPVQISLTERPDFKLDGKITREAGELDARTRQLLTEIDVDNREGKLVAGSFVTVSMALKTTPYLRVPVEALVLKDGHDYVPVVELGDSIHYQSVDIGRNNGKYVEILSGLKEGDLVALNLGDSVREGGKVRELNPAPRPVANTPNPVTKGAE